MSEEQKENENGKKPAADSAPASSAEDAAPAIPAGPAGSRLEAAQIPVTHLGADAGGNETISLEPAHLLRAGEFLRDDCHFDLLLSCTGVDWKDHRESVYHLYSTSEHTYLTLKVTAEADHSPSLTPVWNAADWHERESYDLLGIHYDGHPNLTRILMPNDWLGYPLRKDYKVDDPRLVWNER